MTKLEEKLIELGYVEGIFQNRYIKYYQQTDNYILVQLYSDRKKVKSSSLYCGMAIYKQKDIETLQQAFNEMQKDLEVLKEYEKCN